MAQYKHDRFFKFYIQSLYKTKGDTQQNIKVHNDEDLEIDLMFIGDRANPSWNEEDLGLFDLLMKEHPTIVIEHYSSYLEETDINKSITRKNLYWEPKLKELVEVAKKEQKLTDSNRLLPEVIERIESQNPFTWILTVNCSEKLMKLCNAQPDPKLGVGVYRLAGLLRMGIVVISKVADSPESIWLKMLGDKESAQNAFGSIEQLSPNRREKNDIISACIKYCVYLKDLPSENLTLEEQDFMKTMAQIDALYDAEINKARIEGELQGEVRGEQRQQQAIALKMLGKNIPLETISEVTGLTIDRIQQLQSDRIDLP
jgi:hypothetical protein